MRAAEMGSEAGAANAAFMLTRGQGLSGLLADGEREGGAVEEAGKEAAHAGGASAKARGAGLRMWLSRAWTSAFGGRRVGPIGEAAALWYHQRAADQARLVAQSSLGLSPSLHLPQDGSLPHLFL